MKISLLYGTETGNAEMLAEDIQTALEADHDVTCSNLGDVDPASLDGDALHVIVCSTYGEGELPASARPFMARLEETGPDLSHMRFAIFGLGDSEYAETFTHGSLKLAEKLQSCGAAQIGPRLTHNASGSDLPEELALPWINGIVADIG